MPAHTTSIPNRRKLLGKGPHGSDGSLLCMCCTNKCCSLLSNSNQFSAASADEDMLINTALLFHEPSTSTSSFFCVPSFLPTLKSHRCPCDISSSQWLARCYLAVIITQVVLFGLDEALTWVMAPKTRQLHLRSQPCLWPETRPAISPADSLAGLYSTKVQ